MKAFVGILFFLIPLVLCSFFARSIHQKHIERDLSTKVSDVLTKHGLDPAGLQITNHHLTQIGQLPSSDSAREELQDELDGIIGLYVDLDAFPAPTLAPPSFRLTEQADQSIILTGLIRDESERKFLVNLASTPINEGGPLRKVIDQLELTDDVAPIQPTEQIASLTQPLLSSAEEGYLYWSPTTLEMGGLLEKKDQESQLLTKASNVVSEDASPLNKLRVQPFQELNFGFKRENDSIIVTGLLPDTATRDRLLGLVKSEAKTSRVIDKTTLAVRPLERWWAKSPDLLVPDFLSKTQGPARLHYYHRRFVAEATFSEESDYIIAKNQIGKLSTQAQRETKLAFIKKPAPIPEPEPKPAPVPPTPMPQPEPAPAIPSVAADNLVKELKNLAVYFASSSSYIKKTEDEKIDKAARLILSSKDVSQGLTVGGYADLRGNADYNRNLSLQRANAVRDRLIKKGVPADRLTVNHFGEDTSQTAKDDLWKSRRVEISLTPTTDQ